MDITREYWEMETAEGSDPRVGHISTTGHEYQRKNGLTSETTELRIFVWEILIMT